MFSKPKSNRDLATPFLTIFPRCAYWQPYTLTRLRACSKTCSSWWVKQTIEKECLYIYIPQVGVKIKSILNHHLVLQPPKNRKLIRNLQKGRFGRWTSFWREWCSGSMLVFGGAHNVAQVIPVNSCFFLQLQPLAASLDFFATGNLCPGNLWPCKDSIQWRYPMNFKYNKVIVEIQTKTTTARHSP